MDKGCKRAAKYNNKRMLSYDVLRVLSALAVIWFHFDCAIRDGHLVAEWSYPTFNFFDTGFGVANIAVSMFFLLSGALASGSLYNDGFDSRGWVRRRLSHLYPAFWMSWLLVWLLRLVSGHVFHGVPWWRFSLTLAGMDGYVGTYWQVPTYGLVGEWFFGAFVILVLIWPFMRKLVRWNDVATFGITFVVTLATAVICHIWFPGNSHFAYRSIPFCELTFLLGLFAVKVSKGKHSVFLGIICLVIPLITKNVFHLSLLSFDELSIAFGIFLLVSNEHVEEWLQRLCSGHKEKPGRWLVYLSNLTLWSFLFQHAVIYAITDKVHALLGDTVLGTFDTLGLCLIVTVLTFCISDLASRALQTMRDL